MVVKSRIKKDGRLRNQIAIPTKTMYAIKDSGFLGFVKGRYYNNEKIGTVLV